MTTQSLLPCTTAVFAGLLCMVTLTFAEISIGTTPSVQYEWTEVNYTETCGATFTPANCVITGVKVYGNSVFLTVPRWKPGVPSTLNVIAADAPKRDPLLKPWPNCRWQEEGNPLALQYVQSMEIDSRGRMWIIDVGRRNFAAGTPDNTVHPKIVVVDVASCNVNEGADCTILSSYTFSNAEAPWDSSFMNDIVLDENRGYAYISNTGEGGGIIVYDFNQNTAKLFTSPEVTAGAPQPLPPLTTSYASGVTIHYPGLPGPSDGIALTPSTETLYFCALDDKRLFRIATADLRNFALSNTDFTAKVELVGLKPDHSDGLVFSSDGTLYFGGLTTAAVYKWNPAGTTPITEATVFYQNDRSNIWVDTFAFQNTGLLWTTNNLATYFQGEQYGRWCDSNASGICYGTPYAPFEGQVLMYLHAANIGAHSYLFTQAQHRSKGAGAGAGSGAGAGEESTATLRGTVLGLGITNIGLTVIMIIMLSIGIRRIQFAQTQQSALDAGRTTL